ncbi:hypothetical protein GTP58_24210 [Duganella sp. CY15W]|uniref:hypothetical protein n=1 Tax=Duganella sp. CY15W TaxID=2692172 RepID=UPI00136E0FF7|nr:hypothetical protein [Duganella sp. CY15W]MYM31442.1 hypothetical protein [Duganella sp. CY15W]
MNKHTLKLAALLALAICCGALSAKPAPWWRWNSKIDPASTACAQTSPGEGWERGYGPYQDARCEKLLVTR